jgi:hypothetical protein
MARGVKTGGGSRKGRPNKATAAKAREIAASGQTPLDYMLGVMRARIPKNADFATKAILYAQRLDAAKSAAPYIHPKLANVVVKGDPDSPVRLTVTDGKL